MAVMTDLNRVEVWGNYIKHLAEEDIADVYAMRDDIKAAVDAADQWVSDNQTSYNTALPEPFKSWATAQQKAYLLAVVIMERFYQGV